jgi:PAS domain S-box-containing protein
MILQNFTIRKRLQGTALGISILLVGIGIITRLTINETLYNYSLLGDIKNLLGHELKMRKAEKDFLFLETIQPEFYETGESANLEVLEKHYELSLDIIDKLQSSATIKELELEESITELEKDFRNYKKSLKSLEYQIKVKGFKDYGNIGKMRAQIHEVETFIKEHNDTKSGYYMLMLRRHEKDYLLRKDVKYLGKFVKTYTEYINYIDRSPRYSNALASELTASLSKYKQIFESVIKQDKIIGYSNEIGILSGINNSVSRIEENLSSLESQIIDASNSEVQKATLSLFVIIASLSILILLILFTTSQNIIKPIEKLKNHILKLGSGELPGKISIKGKNEITQMVDSLNVLTENLANTKNFAIEVGNGNLDTQINVFNNKGDLGGSLITMRKQLLHVAQERDKQKEIDKRNMWVSEGIAKIEKILRDDTNHINDVAQNIISLLVKYLNANQGGVYLRDNDTLSDENEVNFNLVAAYAYGRKKFIEGKVKMGEDLVGTCAIEGESIIMTDIPEEYITITSGLGHANPRFLALIPMKKDDTVLGVLEIASLKKLEEYQVQFVETIASNFGASILSIRQKIKTEQLLEQSRYQANELKAQEEELRQNMEELAATQEAMTKNEEQLKKRIVELEKYSQEEVAKLKNQLEIEKLSAQDSKEFIGLIDRTLLLGELTAKGNFISANGKFLETLEYSESEILNKNIRNFITKDEMVDFEIVWNKILQGEICSRLSKRRTKSGEQLWLKTTYSPLMDKFNEVEKIYFVAKVHGSEKDGTTLQKEFQKVFS